MGDDISLRYLSASCGWVVPSKAGQMLGMLAWCNTIRFLYILNLYLNRYAPEEP